MWGTHDPIKVVSHNHFCRYDWKGKCFAAITKRPRSVVKSSKKRSAAAVRQRTHHACNKIVSYFLSHE
jgi:hypothetical protein